MNKLINIQFRTRTTYTNEAVKLRIEDALFDLLWSVEMDYIHIHELTEKDELPTNPNDKE